MPDGRFKTTMVLIATKRRTRVFSSLNDIPSPDRGRVEQAIHSDLSQTILIADDRGCAELARNAVRARLRRHHDAAAMRFAVKASLVGAVILLIWIALMLRG